MELWVKLVPNFFGKAKLAQLSKDSPQKVLLIQCQIVLSNLKEHRFRLTKVAPSCLTEKESQVLTDPSLSRLFELDNILKHKSCKMVFDLSLELFHGL